MTFEELLYKYKNTYYSFPQPLKTFLGGLYGTIPLRVRFGNKFVYHSNVLKQYENASDQFKLDYMYNKTLETVIFAEKNITYYKELFKELGISSKDFRTLDDLKLFPLISKKDIKDNHQNIYTNTVEKVVPYYSGGSMSTPTKFFLPASSRAKEKAYTNYIFSKINYRYRDKIVILKGRELSKPEKNIFWDYDPIDNFFYVSNNYMNSEAFPLIYEEVLKFNGKFFFGYPSAILSFIRQSKKYNLKKINISGVILSSETVYSNELKEIRDWFGVDVLTHYGHTERNITAYRMNNDKYHFMNSYGLTRVVDQEIVSTTFDNFVMPFINYRTEDYVAGEISYINNTDIVTEVENIEGRTQDFLVTDDHRLVSITTMCGGQHLPLDSIDAIQYVQDKPGAVTVLVEADDKLDIKAMKNGMHKLVRDGINFEIKHVDEIGKSSRGKRIICKQNLKI